MLLHLGIILAQINLTHTTANGLILSTEMKYFYPAASLYNDSLSLLSPKGSFFYSLILR